MIDTLALGSCAGWPREETADRVLLASEASSNVVHVLGGWGGCSSLLRTDVDEGATTVQIRVVVRTTGDTCQSVLSTKDIEVTLGAPLGTRRLSGECDGPEGTVCFALKSSVQTTSGAGLTPPPGTGVAFDSWVPQLSSCSSAR